MPDTTGQTIPLLTYDQARDIFEKAKSTPFFANMDLPTFSRTANEMLGTPAFASSLNDNVLKQANYRLNKMFSVVGKPLGEVTGAIPGALGVPQYGEMAQNIGEAIPRGVAETAALFAAPELGAVRLAKYLPYAARALGAASAGTQTYSATDSPKAGLFTGLTSLAMPGVVHAAEAAVPKLFGKLLGLEAMPGVAQAWQAVNKEAGQTAGQVVSTKALEASARNLAFMGFSEAQMQGNSLVATGQFAPPTEEHLVELAAGQLAFAPLDILGITSKNTASRLAQVTAQAIKKDRVRITQRANAAIEEVQRAMPVADKVNAMMSTLQDSEKELVRRSVGITQQKLSKAIALGTPLDMDTLTFYEGLNGKQPVRGNALLAVHETIDEVVKSGKFKLEGTKLIPTTSYDLKNQKWLDITGEQQDAERVRSDQRLVAIAGQVLEGRQGDRGGNVEQAPFQGHEPVGQEVGKGNEQNAQGNAPTGQRQGQVKRGTPAVRQSGQVAPAEYSHTVADTRLWLVNKDMGEYKAGSYAPEFLVKRYHPELFEGGVPNAEVQKEGQAVAGERGAARVGEKQPYELPPSQLSAGNADWLRKDENQLMRWARQHGYAVEQARGVLTRIAEGAPLTEADTMAKLQAAPEAAAPAPAETTAQRAWRILETVGGAKEFAKELTRNDPEGRTYDEMDARRVLQQFARPAVQEALANVLQQATPELTKLRQLEGRTIEKTTVKVPLKTEPGKVAPEGYAGPTLEQAKLPEQHPPQYVPDFATVTDVASAQRFVRETWQRVWKGVQGFARRTVPVEREVTDAQGEKTTKVVMTEGVQVIARKPEFDTANLKSFHDGLVTAVVDRLKQKGVEAKPSDFDAPPSPILSALGIDEARDRMIAFQDKLQGATAQVGSWLTQGKQETLSVEKLPGVEPTMWEQVVMGEDAARELSRQLVGNADRLPQLRAEMDSIHHEFQMDLKHITDVERKASEAVEMYRNALQRRVERLTAAKEYLSEQHAAAAQLMLAKHITTKMVRELKGIPESAQVPDEVITAVQDHFSHVSQVVNDYDARTLQRKVVEEGTPIALQKQGPKEVQIVRGPIVQALLDVLQGQVYEKDVKGNNRLVNQMTRQVKGVAKGMPGGQLPPMTPTEILNSVAMFRMMEWASRLIEGKEGKNVGENLWTYYATELKAKTKVEPVDGEVARAAFMDLLRRAQGRETKFGATSPAVRAMPGRPQDYLDQVSDAERLAMYDASTSHPNEAGEVQEAMPAFDQAALDRFNAKLRRGSADDVAVGSESDVFLRQAAERLTGLTFDKDTMLGMPMADVVFNQDGSLNRGKTSVSKMTFRLSPEDKANMADRLNATADVVRALDSYGGVLKRQRSGEGFVPVLELKGSDAKPLYELQWNIINDVGMVSPELRTLHGLLFKNEHGTVGDQLAAIKRVWQDTAVPPTAKADKVRPMIDTITDAIVAKDAAEAKRAGEKGGLTREAVREEVKTAFFKYVEGKGNFEKAYIDPLYKQYAKAVDSSYQNWRNRYFDKVLQAAAGAEWSNWAQPEKGTLRVGSKEATNVGIGERQRLAASAMVDEETRANQLAAGAREFFTEYYRDVGVATPTARLYGDIAARVSLAFQNLQAGTVVRLVGEGYAGQFMAKTSRKFLIGLNPEQFKTLTPQEHAAVGFHMLAHEVGHAMYSRGKLFDMQLTGAQRAARDQNLLWAEQLGPAGRAAVIVTAFDTVMPIMRKQPELETALRARLQEGYDSPQEFIIDLTGLAVLGLASPDTNMRKAVAANYLFSDAHVQSVLQGTFVPLLDIAAPMAKYFEDYIGNKQAAQKFQQLIEGTRKTLNTSTKLINDSFATLQRLEAADKSSFFELVEKGYRPDAAMTVSDQVFELADRLTSGQLKAEVGYAKAERYGMAVKEAEKTLFGAASAYEQIGGRTVPGLIKWFFTAGQLAKKYPVTQPMFELDFSYFGVANAMVRKIAEGFLKKRKFFGGEELDAEGTGLKKVLGDPLAQQVFDEIALLKQGSVEGGEDRKVFTKDEMVRYMNSRGLRSTELQESVFSLHRACEEAAPKLRQATIDMLVDTLGIRVGGAAFMMDKSVPNATLSKDAIAQGETLGRQVWQTMVTGGSIANLGLDEKGMKVATSLQEAYKPLLTFAQNTEKNAAAWMPEVRIGQYKVAYWQLRADGKWHGGVEGYKTLAEVNARAGELQKRTVTDRSTAKTGDYASVRAWDAWQKRETMQQTGPWWTLIDQYATGSLQAKLIDAGVDQATQAKIFDHNWSPITAAMEAAEKSDVSRLTKPRVIAPGREQINMAEGFLHQMNHIPRALAQMYTDAKASLYLNDPTLRGQGEIVNLLQHHHENVVHPQAAEMTAVKKFIFAYYMGFNVSSMLIEPTQQFIGHLPTLTRDSGSAMAGAKSLAQATRMLVRRAKNKDKATGDADLDWALSEAVKAQLLDYGATQELYSAEDFAALNTSSMPASGRPLHTAKSWATSAFNMWINTARTMYSVAPRVNNWLAFTSAYMMARDHGVMKPGTGELMKLSGQGAWNYAAAATRASMGGGGIAGRPVELFHNMGKATGVVGASYSLATYNMTMLSHVARLLIDSIDRRGELSPREKWAARKALGQTLGTQMAFAGALGLPMATGAMAVLEQMFPTLQVNKTVNETVQQMLGEDEQGGGFFTDLVMRGLPWAGTGIDVSSRLQLSSVMGVSQFDGFKVENLLGPGASIVGNAARAMQKASTGRVADATEQLMPTAFKNILSMYRDGWIVRDAQGKPLYEPSPTETVLQLAGLRPAGLTKIRDAQKMAKRADEVARTQQGSFHEELAQKLVDGDTEAVQSALLTREQTEPLYSAVEGARTVAGKAVEKMFPLDFARTGVRVDATTRQKLAQAGGVQSTPEMVWLQTRKSLEAVLGIPGAGQISRAEASMATLVDQLRAVSPLLSVQEARQQAMLLLGRQPQVLRATE